MFYKSQQPLSALCFEKTSAFQFNTTLSDSNSMSVNLPFKCCISCRSGLFDANSVSVGLSEKFEQLDSPSSVSDFIENSFCEDFNSLILFEMHLSSLNALILFKMHLFTCLLYPLLGWYVKGIQLLHVFRSSPHSDTLCSEAMRNQISCLFLSSLLLPLCSTTHSHAVRSE